MISIVHNSIKYKHISIKDFKYKMFTSTNATREFAIKASNAAMRAMNRHECCKSQFKFRCFSCGEMINRGDKITKCTAAQHDGMRLRFRGADSRNGITMAETAFYLAETGSRTWVHIGCNPCYWDSLPEDSNEYSPPALRSAYTDWGCKVSYEFDEWRQRTNHYDMEEFLEKHRYPKEKWMKSRIIHNVTRFQAIWRGYLYKRAYPLALLQKKEKILINRLNNAVLLSIPQGRMVQFLMDACNNLHNGVVSKKSHFKTGRKIWCPFDCNTENEAAFKGTITETQYLCFDGVHCWYYTVSFHDGDTRNYDEKTLLRRIEQADKIIRRCFLSPKAKRFSYADQVARQNACNTIYTKDWHCFNAKNANNCTFEDDDY